MTKPFCIYHGNCADGFGAAYAVWKAFNGEVDFHPGVYGETPPNVAGRDVIMVDFSYKRPVLEALALAARSVLILDHHKTAQADLDGYQPPVDGGWEKHMLNYPDPLQMYYPEYVRALFDMDRSGAAIAWDYFMPDQERPPLIDHIQDRDLWRFELEGTREIQACVFSHPYDFKIWDDLMTMNPKYLRSDGAAIERKHFKDIHEFIGVAKREMVLGGVTVPVLNAPYFWSSDAGHIMAKGKPFAACYWDTPDGRVFSLRSTDAGEDVSTIAVSYGGGGHRNASGFKMPIGWEGD